MAIHRHWTGSFIPWNLWSGLARQQHVVLHMFMTYPQKHLAPMNFGSFAILKTKGWVQGININIKMICPIMKNQFNNLILKVQIQDINHQKSVTSLIHVGNLAPARARFDFFDLAGAAVPSVAVSTAGLVFLTLGLPPVLDWLDFFDPLAGFFLPPWLEPFNGFLGFFVPLDFGFGCPPSEMAQSLSHCLHARQFIDWVWWIGIDDVWWYHVHVYMVSCSYNISINHAFKPVTWMKNGFWK